MMVMCTICCTRLEVRADDPSATCVWVVNIIGDSCHMEPLSALRHGSMGNCLNQ